jgi:hypothetical protein
MKTDYAVSDPTASFGSLGSTVLMNTKATGMECHHAEQSDGIVDARATMRMTQSTAWQSKPASMKRRRSADDVPSSRPMERMMTKTWLKPSN